jgi:hypothetical protein
MDNIIWIIPPLYDLVAPNLVSHVTVFFFVFLTLFVKDFHNYVISGLNSENGPLSRCHTAIIIGAKVTRLDVNINGVVGGLPLPKVLKNTTNMFSSWKEYVPLDHF